MKNTDKYMKDLYYKQTVERSAKYYGTSFEIIEIYCTKYMHCSMPSAPASFVPQSSVYKTIIKRIRMLEKTYNAELRVSKIKKLTELIKAKK